MFSYCTLSSHCLETHLLRTQFLNYSPCWYAGQRPTSHRRGREWKSLWENVNESSSPSECWNDQGGERGKPICSAQHTQNVDQFPHPSLNKLNWSVSHSNPRMNGRWVKLMRLSTAVFLRSWISLQESKPSGQTYVLGLGSGNPEATARKRKRPSLSPLVILSS